MMRFNIDQSQEGPVASLAGWSNKQAGETLSRVTRAGEASVHVEKMKIPNREFDGFLILPGSGSIRKIWQFASNFWSRRVMWQLHLNFFCFERREREDVQGKKVVFGKGVSWSPTPQKSRAMVNEDVSGITAFGGTGQGRLNAGNVISSWSGNLKKAEIKSS